MTQKHDACPRPDRNRGRAWTRGWACLLGLLVLGQVGCEVDSFMDPSVVGRWERDPVVLPILDRIDIIEPDPSAELNITPVRAADLVPDSREYVLGVGDTVQIEIFELIVPGTPAVQTRRIDETGVVRLPVVESIRAAGRTPSQLERDIAQRLADLGVLRDAMVSVLLLQSTQNTYSIIGEPFTGGTALGTYTIPRPDFRLLDALALARGLSDRVRNVQVIRQTTLVEGVDAPPADQDQGMLPPDADQIDPDEQVSPEDLIEGLIEGVEPDAAANGGPNPDEATPTILEDAVNPQTPEEQWIEIEGRWVRIRQAPEGLRSPEANQAVETADLDRLSRIVTQRIIEVPWSRLLGGDMRYNIIVRPGDVIRIPSRSGGFVYTMGQIARPGAYTVPGENELTLKQLVASAGGLGPLAIPERVDLSRRIAYDQEAIIRINLRQIFEGSEPDIFMKPNDMVNVGTNFWAQPLATFRNAFRITYGFGFILDRNFGTDVFQ